MRSIGARNIAIVKKLTKRLSVTNVGVKSITSEVISALPEEMFDTWEGAYSQIENIIHDTVMDNN